MKSVLASYTLSLAVFIPISGWMADRLVRAACSHPRLASSRWDHFCAASRPIFICWLHVGFSKAAASSMMVPVGRLTLVRTFARSELIRAMSFVAIPGLIGPMLGPIAGGLLVAYFHWRVIFFVNLHAGTKT